MKRIQVATLTLSACMLASTHAAELLMSRTEYNASKSEIAARYSSDRLACKSMAGNANDVCVEEARGRKKIAEAELVQSYTPSTRHRFDVRMVRANVAYAVAKERCDDLSGNAKDLCRKEASGAYVTAKAEATLSEHTAEINERAREKTATVKAERAEQNAAAQSTAAEAKRAAEYEVAREKCEVLAGTAKADCVADAKRRFGQS